MIKLLAVTLVLLSSCVSADAQWRHRHHGGGGFAGGLLGGVIGGVIGGAFAPRPYYQPPVYQQPPVYYQPPQQVYYGDPAIQYCIQRFRSYNPQTQSYMGFDGRAHRCPNYQ